MKTSLQGISLIKTEEGCKLAAYADSDGTPTIGYGNIFITVAGQERRVKMGDSITQPYAEALFDTALQERESQLNKALNPIIDKLTQGQWDACIDFTWEFGIGNFTSSTLYKLMLANPYDANIEVQFNRWVHGAHGEILPGLVSRRQKEISLYFNA